MKNNKHKGQMSDVNSKQPPDDRIKPVEEENQEEGPQVFDLCD